MLLQHKPGNVPANSPERSRSFDPAACHDSLRTEPAESSAGEPQPPLPRHAATPRVSGHARLAETPLPPPGLLRRDCPQQRHRWGWGHINSKSSSLPPPPFCTLWLVFWNSYITSSNCCVSQESSGTKKHHSTTGEREETLSVKYSSKKSKEVTHAPTAKHRIPLQNRTLEQRLRLQNCYSVLQCSRFTHLLLSPPTYCRKLECNYRPDSGKGYTFESLLKSSSHFLLLSIIPSILLLSDSRLRNWECWNSRICSLLHERKRQRKWEREVEAETIPETTKKMMGGHSKSHG